MKHIIGYFFIIFLLNGCALSNFDSKQKYSDSPIDFNGVASKLTSNSFCQKINQNTTLYVTDFVNESNLENKSELGFLLANALKVNILKQNCTKNVSLKTFNLGKNLKIGQNGVKILTRDFKNLQTLDIEDDKQIVVGTYVITKQQIILFVKLINLKEGNTIGSNTYSLQMTNEIRELEGIEEDDSSAIPKIKQPFHL